MIYLQEGVIWASDWGAILFGTSLIWQALVFLVVIMLVCHTTLNSLFSVLTSSYPSLCLHVHYKNEQIAINPFQWFWCDQADFQLLTFDHAYMYATPRLCRSTLWSQTINCISDNYSRSLHDCWPMTDCGHSSDFTILHTKLDLFNLQGQMSTCQEASTSLRVDSRYTSQVSLKAASN